MAALWSGHEFSREEFESWTQEIAESAIGLASGAREVFLDVTCDGSTELRRAVTSLLEYSFRPGDGPPAHAICRPGEVLCDCVILSRIGTGGAAEVYKAIQRPLRRLVAVKVLRNVSDDERVTLAREAARTAQLQQDDDHIVAIYDADFAGAKPCVVMEYVDGRTLRQWLERQRDAGGSRLQSSMVTAIVTQLCGALRHAHTRGIVHRDIKPENILVRDTGRG